MPANPVHQHLQQCVQAAAAEIPMLEVTSRAMFGGFMLYTSGKSFGVLAEQGLSLKLNEQDRQLLLAEPGATPMQHDGGPPSKQYVVVPSQIAEQPQALAQWLERSVAYVQTLPAKPPKRARVSK